MQTQIVKSNAEGCVLAVVNHYTAEEVRAQLEAITRQLQDARSALDYKKRIDAVLAEVAKDEENSVAVRPAVQESP